MTTRNRPPRVRTRPAVPSTPEAPEPPEPDSSSQTEISAPEEVKPAAYEPPETDASPSDGTEPDASGPDAAGRDVSEHTDLEPALPVDSDSPWKELIEHFFFEFMRFFHPEACALIDWTHPPEFLPTELAQISVDARKGRRFADQLVKARLLEGGELFVAVHIEVQGWRDPEFGARMSTYWWRSRERFGLPVLSIAILADDDPKFRPRQHVDQFLGHGTVTTFYAVKLLDYRERIEELLRDPNPFGLAVVAHLRSHETRRDAGRRFRFKRELVLLLYERRYGREQFRRLFRVLDWLLRMPRALEAQFRAEIEASKEAKRMPYVTSWEEMAFEKGEAKGEVLGLARGALRVLRRRWGEVPERLSSRIVGLALEQLDALADALDELRTPDDLEAWLARQEGEAH